MRLGALAVVAALAVGVFSGPAAALDEAQITEVTCDGLRVTQRGLPARLSVEVAVLETSTGHELAEVDARADAGGSLDVRVPVALRGVRQIVVEVESGHTEYGEAGADLPQPCTRSPSRPVITRPTPTAAPVASPRMIGPIAPGTGLATPQAPATPAADAEAPTTPHRGRSGSTLLIALGVLVAGALGIGAIARSRP